MEDLLRLLMKDAQAAKFAPIRRSCQVALDKLSNENEVSRTPAYLLREVCLDPLKLALESRTKRLTTHAVAGIEKILKDPRLQSSIETEREERWLPMQILNAVYSTPNLPEDIQVDVMKLLLKMTFTTAWCMNSHIITQVSQEHVDTNDVLSDFNAKGNCEVDVLTEDVVILLKFLTDKVVNANKASPMKQAIPLLLEGIQAILTNCPHQISAYIGFQEWVWQNLCPTMIALLGVPKAEVKTNQQKNVEIGRGTECTSTSSNLSSNTAKVIYSISVEIAKMVGHLRSLRPVLESLFHRILLCSAPSNRHDALKAIRELLNSADRLGRLTVTENETEVNGRTSTSVASPSTDLALLKLIVDSIQECCHSNESSVCITSVACIDDLLTSVEQLSSGTGITDILAPVILDRYTDSMDRGSRSMSERSFTTDLDETDDVKSYDPTSTNETADSEHHQCRREDNQNVFDDDDVQGEICKEAVDLDSLERQSASDYFDELSKLLPYLLTLSTVTEVDEAIQRFSSSFSAKISEPEYSSSLSETTMSFGTILNADSVYTTTFTALCLNINLLSIGFYQTHNRHIITISEQCFLDTVLDTDIFLYLSPDWLSYVYRTVLTRDLLTEAGWKQKESALITALTDIDGLGSHEQEGQMMSENVFRQEEEEETCQQTHSTVVQAGKQLSHYILSSCWDGILDVLSVLLNGKSSCGITSNLALMLGTEGAKEESMRARDATCNSLQGLQRAAKLCCSLGLQQRCGAVFSQLANTSCVMEDVKQLKNSSPRLDNKHPKSSIIPTPKPKLVRLHAAHVLSMDAMMTTGLEMGSHSSDCWKHVFRCCGFISELEHTYFSSGNNQSSLPRIQQEQAMRGIDDSTIDSEMYGVSLAPVVPFAPRISVPNLIKQSRIESGWDRSISGGGVLNHIQASQALCGLSQEVDRLFEDAACSLNMSALMTFLNDLCEASKLQLQQLTQRLQEEEELPGDHHHLPVNSLHLYRLQEVLMKVVNSDRPLLHLLKSWGVVSAYLVEAAGHRDRSISKMAVACVHDFIITVMTCHMEMSQFHTNEMLCKTFENILCLELCDGDVQDQIVCSICELVEASALEIRSGWRPLFGALRAVRIEYTTVEEVNEARQRHIEAVLDVFDVYLNTDNIQVFANATVDCILCLLKYVRGPGEFEDSDDSDCDSISDEMSSPSAENLCVPALQYLKQCSIILQSMWTMPACPVFHGAHRIQVDSSSQSVDQTIPNMDFERFAAYFKGETKGEGHYSPEVKVRERPTKADDSTPVLEDEPMVDNRSLNSTDSGITVSITKDMSCQGQTTLCQQQGDPEDLHITLGSLDNHTGILHVWYLLLEGLAGAVASCPKSYQPQTLEMLFELLRSANKVPGPRFGVYCMNHLLLPMLQTWLRSGSRKYGYWETGATNFKQCCGHTTDLVVDLIHDFKDNTEMSPLIGKVLKQLLVVLTECVAQPVEIISRLGCSCIRHVVLSAGHDFTGDMWQTITDGLHDALDVTTYCLRQLMLLFHANSESFYGDIGQVKVATRKDCSAMEFIRIWHLAQQVFLLDSQISMSPPKIDVDEDKSYVFLLYPPGFENSLNPDHILASSFQLSDVAPIGIPFRSIVVGLLSNQLLLQTVGCILLENNTTMMDKQTPDNMPGMLSHLPTKQVIQLLDKLHDSYKLACDFDLRPGLKFLVQKVAHTEVAVNLYKQAGASMVFYIHTLIRICSNLPELSTHKVRTLLEQGEEGVAPVTQGSTDVDDSNSVGEKMENIYQPGEVNDERNGDSQKSDKCNSLVGETGDSLEAKKGKAKTDEKFGSTEKMSKKKISSQTVLENPGLFLSMLKTMCDELCQNYIDILYDKGGMSCVDSMADQSLFFLIAQPDEFPDIPKKADLSNLEGQLEETQARLQGMSMVHAVAIQGEEIQVDMNTTDSKPSPVKPEPEPVPPLVQQPVKSKQELRSEHESRVYNLATDKLIKNLMTEYKKRKNQHAMPSFVKPPKKKKEPLRRRKSSDPVEEVIEQQQKSSIMKDSEAHLLSWTELLCTILGLLQQLNDKQFMGLLPTVFSCVNHLVCHAHDMRLREQLAQWLHRVGGMFALYPPGYTGVEVTEKGAAN